MTSETEEDAMSVYTTSSEEITSGSDLKKMYGGWGSRDYSSSDMSIFVVTLFEETAIDFLSRPEDTAFTRAHHLSVWSEQYTPRERHVMGLHVVSRFSKSTEKWMKNLMRLSFECMPLYKHLALGVYIGLTQELPIFSSLRRRILTQLGRDLKRDIERNVHATIETDRLVMPLHLNDHLILPLSIWEKTLRRVSLLASSPRSD